MSFYLHASADPSERAGVGIEWEDSPCLLCGCADWVPLVEAPDRACGARGLWFMVVQCRECGLAYTNPRPSVRSLAQFYAQDYRPHQFAHARARPPHWWQRLPLLRQGQDLARKALPIHGQGRLLDYGCGSGSFLLRMRRQGWTVTGLDMAEAVVERLRSEFGLHALTGSLPHPALDDASFDVITMWQALEHVHEPLETLQAAHKLLVPGGKLLVSVPNIGSLAFRWFGLAWNGLDLPRHLVHFTPATLRHILQRAGFRAIRIAPVRRSGWLRDSARVAASCFAGTAAWHRWLQGRTLSNLVSWYSYWTRQADCLLATARR
jgi:2-polyprenyl-3-methyl-5-hydroxy-6-metoxy-1,4-benzoquinol methylase